METSISRVVVQTNHVDQETADPFVETDLYDPVAIHQSRTRKTYLGAQHPQSKGEEPTVATDNPNRGFLTFANFFQVRILRQEEWKESDNLHSVHHGQKAAKSVKEDKSFTW